MQRKPTKKMLGLLVWSLVASTAALPITAAQALDRPGDPRVERSAPAAGPSSGDAWTGQSPRYGVRVVVTSGVPLDLQTVDALVEALIPQAGSGPRVAEDIEIGMIPHAQLQEIAAAVGIPEEVLCIRHGSQILLTDHLLASSPALTLVLGNHLFQTLREQGGPVQQVQFGH